jgi:hypothetical protein
MPRPREAIGDGATVVPRRPVKSANDVEDLGAQRIIARGVEDALLQRIAAKCFAACKETGSGKRPLGSQHQRRSEAAAVGNAACRKHGDRTHRIDDLRQEREDRAPRRAMATRFRPLRYDDIGSKAGCISRLGERADLEDESSSSASDLRNERRRIAKGKKDWIGTAVKHTIE